MKRYTKNTTKNTVPTIGVEYATKCVLLKNGAGIVKAQIWDTCIKKQEYFEFINFSL